MNKLITAALAAIMAVSLSAPALAAPADTDNTDAINETPAPTTAATTKTGASRFSDITDDFEWAKTYINQMASKGLISGYEDGTYRPDNLVTRQEDISLFARAMGSVDDANEDILDIAEERYGSIVKNYNLGWGISDIEYMMYRGALKKTDLDTYLKDSEKEAPMKRYEAAIIITKAMGGEEEALSDLGVVLDYTDAREVPANAIQYVAYATEKGIMEGMGDGTFSPNTPVTRAQIAVMLSRTVDKVDYSFDKTVIKDIDTGARTITAGDDEKAYIYTDDTKFKTTGDEAQAKDIQGGVDAVLTFSGNKLLYVDVVSAIPDQTVTGRYVSYATTSGKTTIRITEDESGESVGYECDTDVTVTYQGSPATVRSFTKGDVITLELHNGKVVKITGDNKETTITNATVENVDITDDVTITITHANSEYDGKTYNVASDVSVKKNDSTVGLDSIYPGDKVKLTLQYGVITKIVATSTTKTVEGTIRSLTIASPQSTMTVSVKGQDVDYVIPADVEILVNGNEGSLYNFRVGDAVKITTDSGAITKIVATSTQESSGNITGVVTGINTSYGVVSIRPDGSEISTQVFCKDDSTTVVSAEGKTKKMKDVKEGQSVEVRGTVSNGVFVGKLLIILSE